MKSARGGRALIWEWQKLVPEFDIDPEVDGFTYSVALHAVNRSVLADIVNELLVDTPA